MMNAWETEDEHATAAQASLPTPTDTPYRTPSRTSRRSTQRKSVSPVPSSSPPPLPHGEGNSRRNSKDITNDESISILDPRRFTPTLHANLVAEILALRRDQEEKTKIIENLETTLHASRGEHESVATTLAATAKETRSLKRQLALLEGGTSSALGELARERDEAVDSVAEHKKRLEVAQKKLRSQEEDSDRVHELWARDKDTWEDEKRKYERKVHAAEGRLKTVLEEVAAYQAAHQNHLHNGESEAEEASKENGMGHGSDTASIRSMSMTNSVRFSMMTSKMNGVSLADELDLEEEEDLHTDHDGRESALSFFNHRRNQSRESVISKTHLRNQSIDSLRRPGSVAHGRLLANQVLDKLHGGIVETDEEPDKENAEDTSQLTNTIPPSVNIRAPYVDIGVQYSPPPTPELKPTPALALAIAEHEKVPEGPLKLVPLVDTMKQNHVGSEWEIEANQRRKRVRASPPLIIEPIMNNPMISAGSQTLDDPPSPPRTPKSPTKAAPLISANRMPAEMKSSVTQTDFPDLTKSASQTPIPIPSISIHPPSSRPATPREPRLPQYFKDVACQASLPMSVSSRSASVQTEEIRVDKRLALLPKHLQPSSISSKPPSPEPPVTFEKGRYSPSPVALPPRNPRRVNSQQSVRSTRSIKEIPSSPPRPQSLESQDAYPGNNDEGPLGNNRGSGGSTSLSLKRPRRSSSLFAGFDGISSDDGDDFGDADMSDNDFRTALSAPKPKSSVRGVGKRISVAPTSVPEDVEPTEERPHHARSGMRQFGNYDSNGFFSLPDAPALPGQKGGTKPPVRQLDKPLALTNNAKQSVMRRTALISNGIAAHQGRSRSPSFPEAVKEPPFPIPTRASSRKPPFSISAPSEGNRSPTQDYWGVQARRASGRGHYRANSIRKVRSAAAIPGNTQRYRRRGSRSPPPLSASTEAPESPRLPPMPFDDITSPAMPGMNRFRAHKQQPSTNTANTSNTGGQSVGSSQATSVVDAIAQTMVGEWMFKYVRRRKSFGVPEQAGFDGENGTNGVRHKRWVWLAPYERAVMWSSKQPTSGSALMGKSGRKLTIQSVLDVKDDNPAPKGVSPIFNRSILILTPARALKFTATTRERHYVWLTALSFLAHSSQTVPDVMAGSQLPQLPQQIPDFEIPRQPARLRKNPIRDSIRVAKGKNPTYTPITSRSGPLSGASSQNGGDSIRTDASTRNGGVSEPGNNARDLNYFISPDAADPPVVPRFSDRPYPGSHGRKRSNTGSRIPPPLSFRGFSDRGPLPPPATSFSAGAAPSRPPLSHPNGNGFVNGYGGHNHAPSTAGLSVGTNDSSEVYQSQRSSSGAGYGASGRSSVRTSDASGRPSAVIGNFFDAVGTVRMEAFISPMGTGRFDDYLDEKEESGMVGASKRRSRELGSIGIMDRRSRDGRRRSRNRDSYFGGKGMLGARDDWFSGSRTAGEEEYGYGREKADDPFRGF